MGERAAESLRSAVTNIIPCHVELGDRAVSLKRVGEVACRDFRQTMAGEIKRGHAGVVGERVRNASHAAISEDRGGARRRGGGPGSQTAAKPPSSPSARRNASEGATPMSAQAVAYRVAVEGILSKEALSSEDEKPLNKSI